MSKLERIRHSPWGTFLFYGYLVAVVIAGGIAIAALHGLHQSDLRLKAEIAAGHVRDERSCRAIAGASQFWSAALEAIRLRLTDPKLSAIDRQATTDYMNALTIVVAATTHPFNCEVPK